MTFFSSLFCLIHPSIHPWSWRQRLSPLSFSACLRLFISKGMFRKRYCLSWFSQKRSPCILLFKWGLKLIPPLFLLHFHPSWLNQAIILKGNFRLFVTSPLRSLPATFGEERAKPLDQSNLFLTHFHSQGLPLQEERDRNKSGEKKKKKKERKKSDILALGTCGRSSSSACRVWAWGSGARELVLVGWVPNKQKVWYNGKNSGLEGRRLEHGF